jgi:hypothetical protein
MGYSSNDIKYEKNNAVLYLIPKLYAYREYTTRNLLYNISIIPFKLPSRILELIVKGEKYKSRSVNIEKVVSVFINKCNLYVPNVYIYKYAIREDLVHNFTQSYCKAAILNMHAKNIYKRSVIRLLLWSCIVGDNTNKGIRDRPLTPEIHEGIRDHPLTPEIHEGIRNHPLTPEIHKRNICYNMWQIIGWILYLCKSTYDDYERFQADSDAASCDSIDSADEPRELTNEFKNEIIKEIKHLQLKLRISLPVQL